MSRGIFLGVLFICITGFVVGSLIVGGSWPLSGRPPSEQSPSGQPLPGQPQPTADLSPALTGTDFQGGGGCAVGGCSNQLCVDANDADGMVTTCEYREEYGCYKNATCERQQNGECGWTQTQELLQCTNNAMQRSNNAAY